MVYTSNEQKKISGNWLLFFGESIQRHPDSVCENDVNKLAKCSRVLYAKPLNERLTILLQKKNGILASIF